MPPLRARHEDIIVLADYFLARMSHTFPGSLRLAPDAVGRMLTYSWPGNVRELEHVLSAAAALAAGVELHAADLRLPAPVTDARLPSFAGLLDLPLMEAKEKLLESFERTAIQTALDRHDGNVSAAARRLGIHRQSLQQKMTQLGLRRVSGSV